VPLSWRKRSASQKDAATQAGKDRYRQSTGKHHEVKIRAGPTRTVARSIATPDPRLDHLKTQTIEKWIVALSPAQTKLSSHDASKLQALSVALKIAPEATMGKSPANGGEHHGEGAERGADKGDEAELERQAATQFFNHSGAISRSDHRKTGHRYAVAECRARTSRANCPMSR